MPPTDMSDAAARATAADMSTQAAPQVEGKRTQLKVIRENVQTLSSDIGNFRRSHELSTKKLEKQVATLRNELAAQSLSKNIGDLRKSHDAMAKRLEKQVVTLRKELADLKGHIAKDAARSRAKQEATLSRILAKVSTKPSKPSKPVKSAKKPAKSTKRK
jgi:capsule polysaccharide export protein KpsE/RkpR